MNRQASRLTHSLTQELGIDRWRLSWVAGWSSFRKISLSRMASCSAVTSRVAHHYPPLHTIECCYSGIAYAHRASVSESPRGQAAVEYPPLSHTTVACRIKVLILVYLPDSLMTVVRRTMYIHLAERASWQPLKKLRSTTQSQCKESPPKSPPGKFLQPVDSVSAYSIRRAPPSPLAN